MSENEELKEGAVFALGLSEKDHGADLYSTEMSLSATGEGEYVANGTKYYIGNANRAAMVSTFGKVAGTEEQCFFVVDSSHPSYRLVKNVMHSQNYVGEYTLEDYPITDAEIPSRGEEAWNAALNTVNIGKYNLGWGSIGMCTHAMYEALHHAAHRHLYGMTVADFPHVKRLFTDAYVRLVAMKLVALRAADYMRSATPEDRRYLLYNPVVKMKVTTQGEDVIAAKGFEKDLYFEMAARDIRSLPKLEGTVHVNIALIVKFMKNYFFESVDMPAIPRRDDAANDDFLFNQGPTRGLGDIRFHDYTKVFARFDLPNVELFVAQADVFKTMLAAVAPSESQTRDTDWLLAVGEIFTLIVYAQLVLENAEIYDTDRDIVDEIFDVVVRDMSRFAVELYGKAATTAEQGEFCQAMLRKPASNADRYERVWQDHVYAMRDAYTMAR